MFLHNVNIWRNVYTISNQSQWIILRFSPYVNVLERYVYGRSDHPPYLLCPTSSLELEPCIQQHQTLSWGRTQLKWLCGMWALATVSEICSWTHILHSVGCQEGWEAGRKGSQNLLLHNRGYLRSTFYVPSNGLSPFPSHFHNTILTVDKWIILHDHIVLGPCK